ncbi:MAG: hypothetical protein ACRC4O_11890 [Giesbergeria sp.]
MPLTISTNGTEVGEAHPMPANLPAAATAGFATLVCEADDGTHVGTRRQIEIEASEDYRMRVGVETPLYTLPCSGTVIDRSSLIDAVTTFTITQGSGQINLNGGASAAASGVARLSTWATFGARQGAGIQARIRLQFTQLPVTNNVCEWGLLNCSGLTAPTDGVFFRHNAAGQLECVVAFNSTETKFTVDTVTHPEHVANNVNHDYSIDWYNDIAVFWIDGYRAAVIDTPPGQPNLVSCEGVQLAFRVFNQASAPSIGQVMKIGRAEVLLQDVNNTRPWKDVQSAAGLNLMQWPPNGATVGPLVLIANTAAPTARTLSNTALADASHGVLAGDFLATLSGLTAQTDYILNAWQNPATGAAIGGRQLLITGLHFSWELAGAANAATIQNYMLSLGVGASAISLAVVADATNGVKCARRIPVARITTAASAAIGTAGNVDVMFETPYAVNAGEFAHVILKPTLYTTVASQTLRYALRVEGHWA